MNEDDDDTHPVVFEDKMIKCGKCHEEMTYSDYKKHDINKHNGLGWLEGEEPFDMTDEKLMASILWKVIKSGKKKCLTCEKCGKSNKSAVGFISHVNFCQKTVEEREALKETCEICGRNMIPASLKVHMNVHKNDDRKKVVDVPENEENLKSKKRAAAKKAASLLQEFIKDEEDENTPKPKRPDSPLDVDSKLYVRLGSYRPSNSVISKWKKSLAREGKALCHNVSCNFEASSLENVLKHHAECLKGSKKGYQCQSCSFHSSLENEMRVHVSTMHVVNHYEESDSEENEDNATKRNETQKSYFKISSKMKFLSNELSGSVHGDRPYLPATRWTLKYHMKNDSKTLFTTAHTNILDWIPVPELECKEYIPVTEESVPLTSICMREKAVDPHSITDLEWKKFKIFQSEVINDVPTFFTGGPVWTLAWCTIPLYLGLKNNSSTNQFLALSCHREMDAVYCSNEKYEGKGLIQLWNFGPLENVKKTCTPPQFVLGIAHEYGVVWCLEWCPSGCYENEDEFVCNKGSEERLRRLGLLAAAFSDGVVRIFSICFPSQLENTKNQFPIYKCDASMVLMLDSLQTSKLGGNNWNCVRLSWFKGKDHRIVAGSFSNGMVALWDLESSSPLLTKIQGKSRIYYPYHTFQAHYSNVTALGLYPRDNGRFLVTGSIDCTVKVWDLEDTSSPISTFRKGMVTDGLWLTHWPSSVTSYDDVYSMGHCNGSLNPPRGYGFKMYPLLAQNSVAWSLSSCDWVNAVAQSTHAGELTAIFPHQLLLGIDTEKGMKDKRMVLSHIELKDFTEIGKEHICSPLCILPCRKKKKKKKDNAAEEEIKTEADPGPEEDENSNSSSPYTQQTSPEKLDEMTDTANKIQDTQQNPAEMLEDDINVTAEIQSSQQSSPEKSQVVETSNIKQETSFLVERHPRTGKKCNIMPFKVEQANISPEEKQTLDINTFTNDGEQKADTKVNSNEEECYSMLAAPEKKLLLCVKKDMERLNLTSKLKVIFPLHEDKNNEMSNLDASKKVGRPDEVKVYQMLVTTAKERTKESTKLLLTNKEVKTRENSVNNSSMNNNESDTTFHPAIYKDVAKKFGLILCDFYMGDMRQMPRESRQWMRRSDGMKMSPIHMYPLMSINKVQWNPNCRSFLWLAAGYQCGLVRVPCVSSMHTRDVERILQQADVQPM